MRTRALNLKSDLGAGVAGMVPVVPRMHDAHVVQAQLFHAMYISQSWVAACADRLFFVAPAYLRRGELHGKGTVT